VGLWLNGWRGGGDEGGAAAQQGEEEPEELDRPALHGPM